MSTFADGTQESYAHIALAMHLPAFPGWVTHRWDCEWCGKESWATFPDATTEAAGLALHQAVCDQNPAEMGCVACFDTGTIGDLLGGRTPCTECQPRIFVGRHR